MVRPTHRAGAITLAVAALIGLLIRFTTLSYMGVFDMDAYNTWGERALVMGLARSYGGIYFPFQYQLFEFYVWVIGKSGAEFFTIFKLSNLLFDSGSFCLLIVLLRRHGSNPLYALLYWLHPWFLAMFSLGYIDFQFAFFVLLCLTLLRGEAPKDYLLAGVALGFAFLMKPQAQILMVAVFLFAVFRYVRRRDMRPLLIVVGPIVLFLAYEVYFIGVLGPHSLTLGATVLPISYLRVTNVMPALSAQMTNIWLPVGYLLKAPGQMIYEVSDQIQVLPGLQVKYLAAALVLSMVGLQVYWLECDDEISISDRFCAIFCFATMAVPFFMTSAHENHLFLGTILLVLLLARPVPLSVKIAGQVLLLVQFLNLYGLYGTHPATLARLLRPLQTDMSAIGYSLVSVACFAFIIKPLWTRRKLVGLKVDAKD